MTMTDVVFLLIKHKHDNDGCGSLIDKTRT
jgi:hypothetical protein